MKSSQIFTLIFCIVAISGWSQDYVDEIMDFRKELNAQYADENESPLTEADRIIFEGLGFYPITKAFRIKATFEKTEDAQPFEMKTTTDRLPIYRKYGIAKFELDGQMIELSIYQNVKMMNIEGYKDYLFLPFKDLSNEVGSYEGGRFIDLKIPESNEIVIDFNKSYNPYCAYNHKYSCPIPPAENFMNVEILAGILKPHFEH